MCLCAVGHVFVRHGQPLCGLNSHHALRSRCLRCSAGRRAGYVSRVLKDARVYSEYGSKDRIDVEDVRLAIRSRINEAATSVPTREILLEMAAKRNAIPLPVIPNEYGVRLPPHKFRLTENNFQHEGMVVAAAMEDGDGAPVKGAAKRGAAAMETD